MTRALDSTIGWPSPEPSSESVDVRADVANTSLTYDVVATTEDVTPGETYDPSTIDASLSVEELWSLLPRSATVRAAAVDGTRLYVGYDDGVVASIDLVNETVLNQRSVHDNRVTDIDTSYNGDVVTCARDGRVVRITDTLETVWEHTLHDDPTVGIATDVYSVSVHKDRVYSGGDDAMLYAVDLEDGSKVFEHTHHTDDITGVAGYTVESVTLNSDAIGDEEEIVKIDTIDLVYSCSSDGFVGGVYARDRPDLGINPADAAWSVNTEFALNTIHADEGIFVGGENGYVLGVDDWEGTRLIESQNLTSDVLGLASDGEVLYAATESGVVQARDVGTNESVWEYTQHTDRVFDVVVTATNTIDPFVASVSGDFTIRAVDGSGEPSGRFRTVASTDNRQVDYRSVSDVQWSYQTNTTGTHDLGLSVDKNRVYAGTLDGSVSAVTIADGSLAWEHSLHTPGTSVYGVVAIDDGSGRELVASAGTDRALRVYNADTDNELTLHGYHDTSIYTVGAEGATVYSGDANGVVEAASLENDSFAPEFTHTHHDDAVYEITVYDGVVYSASSDGTLVAADATDGTLLWRVTHHNGRELRSVDVGPDRVVSGGFDNSVVAMDHDGNVQWRHSHHYRNVYGVHVGADGVVYSGAYDNHVRAADASNGNLLWSHEIQDNSVRDVKYHDGEVFSGSWDGTVISVDNAVFYPFTHDDTGFTFTDNHAPTDFNQQIAYGVVARDDTGSMSDVRVSQQVNVPFTYSVEVDATALPSMFFEEREYIYLDASFELLAEPEIEASAFIPASLQDLTATATANLSYESFVRFGDITEEDIFIYDGLVYPDGVEEVARATILENLAAREVLTNDGVAYARDEPMVTTEPVIAYDAYAPVDETVFLGAAPEYVIDTSVYSRDAALTLGDPETTFDDFGAVSENPETLFEQLFTVPLLERSQATDEAEVIEPLYTAPISDFARAVVSGEATTTAFTELAPSVSARAYFRALADEYIDFDDFLQHTATLTKLSQQLDVTIDDTAFADEAVSVVGRPRYTLDPFVTARDTYQLRAVPELTFVTPNLVRAFLTSVLGDLSLDALRETTRLSEYIEVALSDGVIDYVATDTVPLQIALPTDLSDANTVTLNVEPFNDEASTEMGGEATVLDASDGTVTYRFDGGEADEPGLYYVSWTVEYNEQLQRTFPQDGPMTMEIHPFVE